MKASLISVCFSRKTLEDRERKKERVSYVLRRTFHCVHLSVRDKARFQVTLTLNVYLVASLAQQQPVDRTMKETSSAGEEKSEAMTTVIQLLLTGRIKPLCVCTKRMREGRARRGEEKGERSKGNNERGEREKKKWPRNVLAAVTKGYIKHVSFNKW